MSEFGIEQYLSAHGINPVTVGVRLGGGIAAGELPYYKLLSLGQLDGLRGFKRNRFLGEQKVYLNTEVRWQVFEKKNILIPLKFGMGAFFDVGRVGAASDTGKDKFYHIRYGIGFYAVPFAKQAALTVSAGFSKEEPFLLMIGIGSNSFRKD